MVQSLFKFQDGCVFLKYETLFFWCCVESHSQTCIMLKPFTLKTGMYAVSVHVNGYNFTYLFWYPLHLPKSDPVIIFLFPVLASIFTSCGFVIYLRLFAIWNVDTESATKYFSFPCWFLFLHTSASSVTISFSFSFSYYYYYFFPFQQTFSSWPFFWKYVHYWS